ncbi:restriction endonuclease subunit S [Sediminicoccus rosea]|uniref:Restriction endonuclease subunit S n=1 Tax=Sediminicoccus rosea TaxID=1225128 RepID=A0ABZ0PPU9_9PROT|nr:restriction endonuclease subunit S [Sediminicoccus rosea]WPB87759.1 restriction endonuclease subunit S [Sediminicoccus rosea]
MSSKVKSSADKGERTALVPKLRFPEFQEAAAWETAPGDELFQQVNNREAPPGLPILAITQEHGAIPRHMIDYHVSVTDKSLETYKEVRPGDFIISLRSFQGGIEFSEYHGICSPAYVILRKRGRLSDTFYRQHFKSHDFIQQLTRNLEGLRDGKMISYKQFSELQLLKPTLLEQQKIADCLDSADALIAAQERKVEALRAHKKGLMLQLFPQEGETQPSLRFPEFEGAGEWQEHKLGDICELYQPVTLSSSELTMTGEHLVYGANGVIGTHNEYNHADSEVAVTCRGATCGEVTRTQPMSWITGNAMVVRPRSARLEKDFLFQYFKNHGLKSVISGSAQPQITRAGFAPLPVSFPAPAEQERIADCLSSLDDLIAAESRKIDAFKTHKRGLMQQLFPLVVENDA